MNHRIATVISEYVPMFRYSVTASDFSEMWDAVLPRIKTRIAELNLEPSSLAEVKNAAKDSVGLR